MYPFLIPLTEMADRTLFSGCGVAMITPFNREGAIDFERLAIHTDRLIEGGMDYLVVLGTTAETPALAPKEKSAVLDCVNEACAGRVPLMLGIGGNDTRAVVEAIRESDRGKFQGLLSVSPYYNKPSQEGIYQHYAAIAAVADLPVMLYNVPGRTGSNISADTVLRLASDFAGTIVGIKEASADLGQVMDILRTRPEGFLVLSGDDAMTLPMMAMGGDGLISVIANAYPAKMAAIVSAATEKQFEKARELHYALLPMMQAIFKEGNPAGVKAAMETRGWIDNILRLPLIPATADLHRDIARLNKQLL
jgi:4-hydroxy-tetrahydrodipicolinate synthase